MTNKSSKINDFFRQNNIKLKTAEDIEKIILKDRAMYSGNSDPIIKNLSKHGINVKSIGELIDKHPVEYKSKSSELVPLLAKYLPIVKSKSLREDIIRTLSVPWAGAAVAALLKEFKKTRDDLERWIIGNALSLIKRKNIKIQDEIVRLLANGKYGKSRQMLAISLGDIKDSKLRKKAVKTLITLLDDKDVYGHAIIALRKLNAKEAKFRIERFTNDSKSWVRKEAKDTIRNFSKN